MSHAYGHRALSPSSHFPLNELGDFTLYLQVVPSSVWHINTDPPADQDSSFTARDEGNWWDQVDLVKLILAANEIKEIPDDIRMLPALAVLDVSVYRSSSSIFL